jgi:putative ABC transport system substrate-binding protein
MILFLFQTAFMKIALRHLLLIVIFFGTACRPSQKKETVPVIGFMDLLVDETLDQARQGFFDALKKNGFSEDSATLKVIYRNAQSDIPTLKQIADYFISEKVTLIATNPSLSTINAAQQTREIPICMMVSPSPKNARLLDEEGNAPPNLFGVYEETWYIDTSVALIKKVLPGTRRIGTVYNQAEPQSRDALAALEKTAAALGMELVALPVNNSSESQLVLASLIKKGIDVFFAAPDNTIFASFPTIVKACNESRIPIFTSEAGLVKLGAVAAFGADLYLWGYQSGEQAAQFLKQGNLEGIKPEVVNMRRRVFNPGVAQNFSIAFDSTYQPLN